MNEIVKANNKDQELYLQRKLAYKRSIQFDDWALIFYSEIIQDFDSSDTLRRHMSENAADLQAKKSKRIIQLHVEMMWVGLNFCLRKNFF
jgi:hypothetical protein